MPMMRLNKMYVLLLVAGFKCYILFIYKYIQFLSDVRDRTLACTILVNLMPGCQEETLDIASRVLLKGIVEKLAIHCCQ